MQFLEAVAKIYKKEKTMLVLLAGDASLWVEAKIDHRPAKIRLVLVKVLLMSYLSICRSKLDQTLQSPTIWVHD